MSAIALNFWWSGDKKEKCIHWICKDIMQREKSEGGLGLRCFECLNMAMLMKQFWRLLKYPHLFVNVCLKRRYFKSSELLLSKAKPVDSFIWKSLGGVMEILRSGLTRINDEWKWKYSDYGEYNVRSGYALDMRWKRARESDRGEGSDWETVAKTWGKFWKIRVPD